ncbi:PAK4-inhibitor INKA2 isoform X2 [Genypterus blacodes]
MKEAGDGLHAQMNSMMGALQELKLLQVQTALENLDVSGRPINRGPPQPPLPAPLATAFEAASDDTYKMPGEPSPVPSPRPSPHGSLGTASLSSSSLESERSERRVRSESSLASVPKRWSGYSAPQVDFYGPTVGNPPPEPFQQPQPACVGPAVDLPGILYSLSREGPSLDSEYSQDSADDAGDWTSSLMSRSRNRQPLVLGDNVFADLVGNWLDLPEVEREEGEEEERRKSREERTADRGVDRPDTPAHPLRLSRSQEICRKFSLTTNIFKKFLRSVRPDRDKLLKERPGWMAPEMPEGDLFKRPKKTAPKSTKGSFYLPFWAGGHQGKGRPCPQGVEAERNHQLRFSQLHQQHVPPFPGICLDRRQPESAVEKMQPLFDYNTAVWV